MPGWRVLLHLVTHCEPCPPTAHLPLWFYFIFYWCLCTPASSFLGGERLGKHLSATQSSVNLELMGWPAVLPKAPGLEYRAGALERVGQAQRAPVSGMSLSTLRPQLRAREDHSIRGCFSSSRKPRGMAPCTEAMAYGGSTEWAWGADSGCHSMPGFQREPGYGAV